MIRRFLCLWILLLFLMTSASSTQVTKILEDNVSVENNTVKHSLKAYRDLQNVTVIDFFSNVTADRSLRKESFLGRKWDSVHLKVGSLKKDEKRIVSYQIIHGKGSALLGADIYYLDGEKHRLYPENKTLDVKENFQSNNDSDLSVYLMLTGLMLVLIFSAVYLRTRNK